MVCASEIRNCDSAVPLKVVGSTLAMDPNMSDAPTVGKMVVPSELNACAKVRRLLAVEARPNMDTKGLATTCTVVIPAASTNSANKNNANTPFEAAGTNSRQPAVMMSNPVTADRM